MAKHHIKALLLAGICMVSTPTERAWAGDCIQSQTLGIWENPFAGLKSDITKLEIKEVCTAETVPHIKIRAFTACAPRDCTWGWTIAKQQGEDGLTALFRTFFAKRGVTVSINGTRMDAKVHDNFHDPRKQDQDRSFVLWKKSTR